MSDTGAGGREATPAGGAATRTAPGAAAEYLAGLRVALADLPGTEVQEILDDVGAHLTDLQAELEADQRAGRTPVEPDGEGADAPGPDRAAHVGMSALTTRLGTPAAYAAELRAAAGYPPAPDATEQPIRTLFARLAVIALVGSTLFATAGLATGGLFFVCAPLVTLLAVPVLTTDGPTVPSVVGLPEVRWFRRLAPQDRPRSAGVLDFVASLQPAWWLLRAYLAAVVVVVVFGVGYNAVVVVLVALIAIPVSVWLGRRSRRDRRWLWLVVPLNGFAVGVALVVLVVSGSPFSSGIDTQVVDGAYSGPAGLWQDGDRQIEDIRPVDSAGVPLSGVYLFDQSGRPIDTGTSCTDDDDVPSPGSSSRPYPRGVAQYDPDLGACITVPPAPLVVAVPSSSPIVGSPSPATGPAVPAPAASPTPSPVPVPTG